MQYAEAAINLIDKSSYISQKFYREVLGFFIENILNSFLVL